MGRFRLRHPSGSLDLPEGELVVGRSSRSGLRLDDPLISRRHARFLAEADALYVEDLSSRNGVLVNGRGVSGRTLLAHLDRVSVGNHVLTVLDTCNPLGRPSPLPVPPAPPISDRPLPRAPRLPRTTSIQTAPPPAPRVPPRPPDGSEDTTHVGSSQLLMTLATRALSLGRVDEAEHILGRLLPRLLRQARRSEAIEPGLLPAAIGAALRLSELSLKPTTLDWVFEIHEATDTLMSTETLERLYALVERTHYRDPTRLRAYLASMRGRMSQLGPAERFQVQRVESLERMISA